eukprot:TRINITY_DN6697_c0_g1_i2.p1 TRINITY_DN6697_c0_g1~~TRINITY_DN6697_c0_g1_i2.p1  ORF type:complete len:122 (+),score=28.18 TRINITY_DN6697_c0_g1_i2:171-536(+)
MRIASYCFNPCKETTNKIKYTNNNDNETINNNNTTTITTTIQNQGLGSHKKRSSPDQTNQEDQQLPASKVPFTVITMLIEFPRQLTRAVLTIDQPLESGLSLQLSLTELPQPSQRRLHGPL